MVEAKGGFNPCFNCGRGDHPRAHCPEAQVTCSYCGAAHLSDFCSKGPGRSMRDALTFNAKSAIDRATDRMMRGGNAMQTWHTSEDMAQHIRAAYLLGKSSIAEATTTDSGSSRAPASAAVVHNARPSACNANNAASSSSMTDLTEIDAYINNLMGGSFLTHQADAGQFASSSPTLSVMLSSPTSTLRQRISLCLTSHIYLESRLLTPRSTVRQPMGLPSPKLWVVLLCPCSMMRATGIPSSFRMCG